METDDITSEWETLKALPGSKPRGENVDLRSEYMSMSEHPEFVYRLLETTHSMLYASLWRMKCLGQKRRADARFPGYTRTPLECWVVQHDVMLWKGDRYDHLSTAPPKDFGRIFLAPKKQCCVTLDEVRAQFAKARDRNLQTAVGNVRRHRADIADKEREIATMEAHIAAMTGFIPDLG